jgi:ketosteroid isomerase-like protein
MPVHNRGSLNTLATKVFAASLIAVPFFGHSNTMLTTDEEIVRKLNAGYVRAFMTSDAEWYDRHLTRDFTCILTNGTVLDRATFVSNARNPHNTLEYELSEITVRVHGDAALASAVGTWKRRDGSTGKTRYVDVWVRKNGEWKAVSAQLTALTG